MNRLAFAVCCGLCLLLGVSTGWYFGYTRPSVENQRRLVQNYDAARDAFEAAQEQFSDYGGQPGEFWEAAKVQDEFAALVSLQAFKDLEGGYAQKGKEALASTVAMYYRAHRRDGNTNLMLCIEWVATTNAVLSNAICRKAK